MAYMFVVVIGYAIVAIIIAISIIIMLKSMCHANAGVLIPQDEDSRRAFFGQQQFPLFVVLLLRLPGVCLPLSVP